MPALTRHIPMRRCVACRASLPKAELIRFRLGTGGAWQLDSSRNAGGRGAWLCRDCAERADAKRLQRFFKGQTAHVVAALAAQIGTAPIEKHPGGMHG